ncbi:MAG: hypothetical protein JXA69_12200 [Phycisphaerae bacterium]|nr:hypothetical protein [Phycisphaerae bacterium]
MAQPRLRDCVWIILMTTGAAGISFAADNRTDSPSMLGTVRLNGLDSFDSDSIANNAPNQWTWLSLPHSRLVVNPAMAHTFAPPPRGPTLPLHVGYYVGDEPHRLLNLLQMGIRGDDAPEAEVWTFTSKPGPEWTTSPSAWKAERVQLANDNGLGRITVVAPRDESVTGAHHMQHGAARIRVIPPFRGTSASLRIRVAKTDGAWALKLNTGGERDITIQGDTAQTGTFVYDLDSIDAWRTVDAFDIKLFAIHAGKSVWVDSVELQIRADERVAAADTYATRWYPHKLGFEARVDAAGAIVHGEDFFHDLHTLVRWIEIERTTATGAPAPAFELFGITPGQTHRIEGKTPMLLFDCGEFFYAVAIGRSANVAGSAMPAPHEPEMNNWTWRTRIPLIDGPTDRLAIAVGFATKTEGRAVALERAAAALDAPGPAQRLAARKAEWDHWLAHVPAPMRFGIQSVDAMGITPEQHRRFYYAAWAFVIQNVLPTMPENDFDYPQTPAGKPSLWNYGASRAKASAAWESFLAQQLLVYVLPDVAWDAFEGIMMQVDADGWLNGECLPSRKAQTAWILYAHTQDKDRLARVYPPIRRYLLWREKNPRWIHGAHDYPHEKDASFVDHLLVDLDFAVEIARVLGHDADIALWHARRDVILQNYREWFFPADGPPVEYYHVDSGKRSPGYHNWVCSGLHIRDLPADLAQALETLYLSHHDAGKNLAGHPSVKFGTISFVAYGLLEHALTETATELTNALLRDQMRAGEFSENYHHEANPPIASTGVKPSQFGVSQMIEFTLMNNGVRIDRGRPVRVHP